MLLLPSTSWRPATAGCGGGFIFRRYLLFLFGGIFGLLRRELLSLVLGSCNHRIARDLSLVCCWAEPTTMPVFGSLSAFYFFWLGALLLADAAYVLAAGTSCPTCFGNLAGCSFSSDGRCPARTALEENVATVAAAVAATTVAAGTVLKLHNLISLRFLRMFTVEPGVLNQGPEYREPTTMPDTLEITPRKVVVVYTHQPIHVHTCSLLAHVCQHRHTGQDRSKHNGPRKKHRTKQSVLSASAPNYSHI